MALTIKKGTPAMSDLVADRRLYETADRLRIVEDGSHEAAFLLAPAETTIAAADVARLGLRMVDGRIVQGTEDTPPGPQPEAEQPRSTARKKPSNGV